MKKWKWAMPRKRKRLIRVAVQVMLETYKIGDTKELRARTYWTQWSQKIENNDNYAVSQTINEQWLTTTGTSFISDSFLRRAFQYEPDIEYYAHSKVIIGDMDKECPHCHTEKFKNEPAGTTFSWSVEQDIEKY